MRECFACKEQKALAEFKKDSSRPSGHAYICKPCDRQKRMDAYYKNVERDREKHREYYAAHKTEWQIKTIAYRERNVGKYRAGLAVRNALKAGRLKKLPCQVCGDVRSHGHHPNYSEPLSVVWLCAKHHMERHRQAARQPSAEQGNNK